MSENFEIECPCCGSQIVIDRVSGEVLMHKVKARPASGSLDEMVSQMSARKSEMQKKLDRELENQKDRSRILEEKFKEAMARADKNAPHINPMDLD